MLEELAGKTCGGPADDHAIVLELTDASKSFGGTPALRGVSFAVRAGEIHALVGENGAGKSTLVNILSGVLAPDRGVLCVDGVPIRFRAPLDAKQRGIHLVHQEFALLPESSVTENVFLGSELSARGFLDWRSMRQATIAALQRLGVAIDPSRRASSLTIAERQMVEIARALEGDRVVTLDEPTAALSMAEAEALFGVLRQLRADGHAIVYISHRIGEVLQLADTVTVLKDGQLVGTWPTGQLTPAQLIRHMVGRPISDLFPPVKHEVVRGEHVLAVASLIDPPHVAGTTLTVDRGEIVGIAGLEGHGQDEVLACVAGERTPVQGTLRIAGKGVPWGTVRTMVARGIGFVPEDRKTKGLLLEQSSIQNITLPWLTSVSRFGCVSAAGERSLGTSGASAVAVQGSIEQAVQSLSGGNQQKVVLAKWLGRDLRVLLLNQPTRGVDVGAKSEIYALLRAYADQGGAVLLTSRELPEILGLCDRVLVMRNGMVAAEFGRAATEEQVMAVATGSVTAQLVGEPSTANSQEPDDRRGDPRRRGTRNLPAFRLPMDVASLPALFFLALLCVIGYFGSPNFMTSGNVANVLTNITPLMLIAVGQMFVIGCRGLDLSVGSTATLAATLAATLYPIVGPIGIVIALAGPIVVGLVNGCGVAYGLNPFLMTLASLSIVQGAVFIYQPSPGGAIPDQLAAVAGLVGPIPIALPIVLIVAGAAAVVLRWTRGGLHILASGGDPAVARLMGVGVRRSQVSAYVISAITAAIAGLYLVARTRTGDPLAGQAFTLDSVAAVVLGGSLLAGGRVTPFGTVMGVLCLGLLPNVLNLTGVAYFYQQLLKGFLLIAAVLLPAVATQVRGAQHRRALGRKIASSLAAARTSAGLALTAVLVASRTAPAELPEEA